MVKKAYMTPESTIVFCEEHFLRDWSQWTEDDFGKEDDFEDDNADNNSNWTRDRLMEALNSKIDEFKEGSWRSLE